MTALRVVGSGPTALGVDLHASNLPAHGRAAAEDHGRSPSPRRSQPRFRSLCSVRLWACLLALWPTLLPATSLRFFGNGVNDIDRVKVRIDDPANSNPGSPADIGATDFTLEFWLKGASADN